MRKADGLVFVRHFTRKWCGISPHLVTTSNRNYHTMYRRLYTLSCNNWRIPGESTDYRRGTGASSLAFTIACRRHLTLFASHTPAGQSALLFSAFADARTWSRWSCEARAVRPLTSLHRRHDGHSHGSVFAASVIRQRDRAHLLVYTGRLRRLSGTCSKTRRVLFLCSSC